VLLGIGVALWVVTVLVNRSTRNALRDPGMATIGRSGPIS
jgi:hypothetical protein